METWRQLPVLKQVIRPRRGRRVYEPASTKEVEGSHAAISLEEREFGGDDEGLV
jgi:hypothetical protein